MDLEEIRERFQATAAHEAGLKVLQAETVDDEEEMLDLDEEDSARAVELLEGAKRMLGFFGDRALSKSIVAHDRKRMEGLATEISEFLDRVNNYEYVEG